MAQKTWKIEADSGSKLHSSKNQINLRRQKMEPNDEKKDAP